MAESNFNIKQKGRMLIVDLGYRLSIENAPTLQEQLTAYQGKGIQKIVFDATKLVYISSAGVRVVMYVYAKMGIKKIEFMNCAQEIRDTLGKVGLAAPLIKFVQGTSAQKTPANKWQERLAEMRQKDLEDFVAHNDVVVYQMKWSEENED